MTTITLTGRELARETTGHDKVWPEWVPDTCPACGGELLADDELAVTLDDDGAPVEVRHATCQPRQGGEAQDDAASTVVEKA